MSAPSEPADPMDEASFNVLDFAWSLPEGSNGHVVDVGTAKRIRDEAVGSVLVDAEKALEAMRSSVAAKAEHAFAQGSAYALGQLPDGVAGLLDEIADAVELDPGEHIGETEVQP